MFNKKKYLCSFLLLASSSLFSRDNQEVIVNIKITNDTINATAYIDSHQKPTSSHTAPCTNTNKLTPPSSQAKPSTFSTHMIQSNKHKEDLPRNSSSFLRSLSDRVLVVSKECCFFSENKHSKCYFTTCLYCPGHLYDCCYDIDKTPDSCISFYAQGFFQTILCLPFMSVCIGNIIAKKCCGASQLCCTKHL